MSEESEDVSPSITATHSQTWPEKFTKSLKELEEIDIPRVLDPATSSKPNTAEGWLVPGRKWKGTITIPGQQDYEEAQPTNYYFEIIEGPVVDGIYCLHADDHDAQAAIVFKIEQDEEDVNRCAEKMSHVRLQWQDFETAIIATLDLETGKLEGRVFQLREGGFFDGLWLKSDQTLNCCCLEPLPENPAYHRERRRLVRYLLFISINAAKLEVEESTWCTLFDEACLQSQLLQADMREKIKEIRETKFATIDDKEITVSSKGQNRLRYEAHAKNDRCSALLQHLLYHMSTSSTTSEERHNSEKEWEYRLLETRARIAYEEFDNALRQLEQRVPKEVLYRHRMDDKHVEEIPTCCICMDSVPPSPRADRSCPVGDSPQRKKENIRSRDDVLVAELTAISADSDTTDVVDEDGFITVEESDTSCMQRDIERPEGSLINEYNNFGYAKMETEVSPGNDNMSASSTFSSKSETTKTITQTDPEQKDRKSLSTDVPSEMEGWLLLPCAHKLHLVCALEWFHRSSECPMCRNSIYESMEIDPDK